MAELEIWLQLTRTEQRLVTKLFGGRSLRGADAVTLGNLHTYGLIDEEGLTLQGLQVFKAAFKLQHTRFAA